MMDLTAFAVICGEGVLAFGAGIWAYFAERSAKAWHTAALRQKEVTEAWIKSYRRKVNFAQWANDRADAYHRFLVKRDLVDAFERSEHMREIGALGNASDKRRKAVAE